MNELELKAKEYACNLHAERNLTYGGGQPYSVHLQMSRDFAMQFIYLIPEKWRDVVLASIWLHDTIEDCAITYNNIKFEFGVPVAENVIAVTNDIRGRTRKDRAESSYPHIKASKYASFIKLCDRLANTKYSKDSGSTMFDKYKSELDSFKSNIYVEEFRLDDMWSELERICYTDKK
jgi:(p)ppGpp synthase/HD superfamily hydrolase